MHVTADIDGWRITIAKQYCPVFGFRGYAAEANDQLWGRWECCEGFDKREVALRLADKTGIDREELLTTFGL